MRHSWLLPALLATAGALIVAGVCAGQVTIELVPSAPMVPPGGSVDIDVVVSGLGNGVAPSVGAFDVDVTFDDALFAFTGVSFGALLGDPMAAEALVGGPVVAGGTLGGVFEVSLLPPATLIGLQGDTFTLFSLTFDGVGGGVGVFDATVNAIGDEIGDPLAVVAVVPGTVQSANPLEIPTVGPIGAATLALLLLAGGLVVLRRVGS